MVLIGVKVKLHLRSGHSTDSVDRILLRVHLPCLSSANHLWHDCPVRDVGMLMLGSFTLLIRLLLSLLFRVATWLRVKQVKGGEHQADLSISNSRHPYRLKSDTYYMTLTNHSFVSMTTYAFGTL